MIRVLLLDKVVFLIIFSVLFIFGCKKEYEYQGYVEGRYRYMTVNFSGHLKKLEVKRGDSVKSGQLLFELDPYPQVDQVDELRAQLASAKALHDQAKASENLAQITLQRQQELVKKHAVQQESVDNARSNLEQATANVDHYQHQIQATEAQLAQAEWSQKQKIVTAPVEALVYDTYFLPGEFVANAQPVLSLLAPNDIKVIFFVPENERSQLKVGQNIEINCDGCAKSISGKITFLSPQTEFTPPIIFSNNTRHKLVYRIEAFPAFDHQQLYPGQPVWVKLQIQPKA